MFERLDRARSAVGAIPALGLLDDEIRGRIAAALEDEALELWADLADSVERWSDGDTVVIEFARGGPYGAAIPLTARLRVLPQSALRRDSRALIDPLHLGHPGGEPEAERRASPAWPSG
jgi:endonuclease YncB( thermonuclease family)